MSGVELRNTMLTFDQEFWKCLGGTYTVWEIVKVAISLKKWTTFTNRKFKDIIWPIIHLYIRPDQKKMYVMEAFMKAQAYFFLIRHMYRVDNRRLLFKVYQSYFEALKAYLLPFTAIAEN